MAPMRVIEISRPGGPEVLRLAERPTPEPQAGEVRIAVKAAGVNRPDLLQRQGAYPPPPGVTDVPGLEVAGVIDAVGAGVDASLHDTPVMALLPGGGYAEFATVDARHCLPIPDGLGFAAAAASVETAFTVWANVFEAGRLRQGERLFVHGATSGIGTMAVALGRAFGAEVYGTAGTQDKCTAAEDLGFAQCFNHRTADWAPEMVALGGVDVVLDMVGGDYVSRNISMLRPGGRHVSIAFLGGFEARFNIMDLMRRQLTLTGSTLRARSADEKARLSDALRHHVLPHLASGAVRPVIDHIFDLRDAGTAHRRLEAGEVVGKVVLSV